jgi:hypothetical protein
LIRFDRTLQAVRRFAVPLEELAAEAHRNVMVDMESHALADAGAAVRAAVAVARKNLEPNAVWDLRPRHAASLNLWRKKV